MLQTTKTSIAATDLFNDSILPSLEKKGMSLIRVLADRGTECCGRPDQLDHQPYLALKDIEGAKIKVPHPRPTVSANVATKPSRMSSTRPLSGARRTDHRRRCKPAWTNGRLITTTNTR